jgi:hypothetical protein
MSGSQSDMRSEPIDEMLLIKYLLGDLSEEEQVRVEDRAFADADYRGALEAVEADLIDAYVRGELLPAERRGFERRFLISPQRRKKVAFARDLARVVAEAKAAESASSIRLSAWQALLRLVRGWNPVLQFAAGLAVLIFVVGSSLLAIQGVAMRSRVAVLETQRHDLQARTEELQRQLGEEQARAGSLAAQLQQQQKAGGAPVPLVASLVLLPGLSRAESRREQLVLNPSAQIAHIEIQLEPGDNYPRFRAELRTLRGEEVLIRGSLPRRRATAGYSVSFDVPASALAEGQYELALKGLLNDQSLQDVGYYYFGVQKQ